MVLGFRPLLEVFVISWLSIRHCRALDSVVSWRLEGGNKMLGPNQLMECETLNISLFPETSNPSGGDVSYHVLAFEPGGKATRTLVGYEPSSLHWTTQYPAGSNVITLYHNSVLSTDSPGTQLFLVLLDSFGASLGVLPAMYTVTPGSEECLTKSEATDAVEATQPRISTSVFGRLMPCDPWELTFSGGKPPYSVNIVAFKSGGIYNYSVPSGEHTLSYTGRGELSGQVIAVVRDANGMFGTTSSIINIADAEDTPTTDSSKAFSRCRREPPSNLPFRLRDLPHPTAFRLRRSLSDHPHMQLSRSLVTINSSYADTVVFAICVSLGGTGMVAMAIYAIIIYRRRQKILDAQDTLPRPFEITVPAAMTTMTTHDLTSVPMLDISPRHHSRRVGRCSSEVQRDKVPTRIKSMRTGSASTHTTTTPSQSRPSSSRNTRMHPHLSDTSLLSNHAGPSSHRTLLPRSRTHPSTHHPRSQPDSRVPPGRSSSSLGTDTRPHRTAGALPSRSASVQERRSEKRALWLSRSASELYGGSASSLPRYRAPEYYGSLTSSSGRNHTHRHDRVRGPHFETFARRTNHLRQCHSASPVVRVRPEEENEEGVGVGGTFIFQHQDAGAMQELPPPYHKLIRSGTVV